jgi:hypothetical protein
MDTEEKLIMPRPTNKNELLELAEINLNNLFDFIDVLPDEMKNRVFKNDELNDRDKTIADILCHLYEWHQLLLNWVNANRKGKAMPFLPEPYNWKNYPEMNVEFWKKHQNTSLLDAEKMLKQSHKDVMTLIATFSDEELFTKKIFSWTGTTSLGSYFVSATSSHYDWALKTIKIIRKMIK